MKSNIGHTQAASGVAGVIKMVMAMRHGLLPENLHTDMPSTHVDWSAGAVELLTEARAWPEAGRPRRTGVSSFGVSGTNAHVIVEQAPAEEPTEATKTSVLSTAVPWLVSARGADALRAQADRLREHVTADGGLDPVDVGWTLLSGRSPLEHRAVLFGRERAEFLSGLATVADGGDGPGLVSGSTVEGRLGLVFTGQGSQRIGMGRELYETFPAFAEALDEVCAHLDGLLERPLKDVMFGTDADLLEQTGYAQPALFAVEVALYRLAESFGVRPEIAGDRRRPLDRRAGSRVRSRAVVVGGCGPTGGCTRQVDAVTARGRRDARRAGGRGRGPSAAGGHERPCRCGGRQRPRPGGALR
ncbi:putative Phenolphthiocerol synthesis polyketide synthase type I Pks15/1 [Streptomyces aurantiacus JA 4570]|uniref:Putative Phenolphthiocerol synthesis polyketide synthase type I Pks15/1 n=1 Tax=Streptomyces aurantiacus JA 4570 TaxID=1286094 RepID=S4ANA1_9ACTN|nr:putative Phenolphthiocerol synthesis polyketide synthase type I Pks15/1 [Streptomyces aurantiacus JA 4570]